jgi:hypothetical protein
VLRHAWTGGDSCGVADEYRRSLWQRHDQEAGRLASLTGWNVSDIRRRMGLGEQPGPPLRQPAWWERLWKT